MKGDLTAKILEALIDSVLSVGDLIDALLSSGYGASYSRMEFNLRAKERKREGRLFKERERQRYYSLIYKLKRDGLIKEVDSMGNEFLKATPKGKERFRFLEKRRENALPSVDYNKQKYNKFVIVVFDVPEKERRKRDWLRSVLKRLELKMVQKSVWIGKVKIPKELLDDLFNLKLLDYVEIFEVSKSGSLRQLT